MSGPITDRIDITRHVEPFTPGAHRDPMAVVETSATVRARVAAARDRQTARYAECAWRLNAHAPATALSQRWPLEDDAERLVEDAVHAGRLTRRGAVRVHRLAWSVADLMAVRRGGPDLAPDPHRDAPPDTPPDAPPDAEHVSIALRLRSGEPLMVSTLQRRAG